jgi:disulfide bond formation protein DsbB
MDPRETTAARCLWAAFGLAVLMLAGSLWLSLGLGLKACPLCYYQRTFVMGVVGVLAIGLVTGAQRTTSLALLALPVAVGGLGVGVYHEYLELAGRLECPDGVLRLGTSPQQSLVGWVLLVPLLAVAAGFRPPGWLGVFGGVVLGVLFTVGSVASVAPTPPPPPEAYLQAPDICRPPRK